MNRIPKVATLAFNVKGADLLFLDHTDHSELKDADHAMWRAAGVDINCRPFRRVVVYVPLADDGVNRNTLRTNANADRTEYSYTREFALGIQDLWPYLDYFFDKRSTNEVNLLAAVAQHFEGTNSERGFTLADVLNLFQQHINLPSSSRQGEWRDFSLSTIRAVYQRLRSLPATLGGLIDVTGTGFGLEDLDQFEPFDMVVIDLERIMSSPRDPAVAETAIKIITAYVLHRLVESMTQGRLKVDHVIVFADELNRLAPRDGDGGIGEFLAQIARTTRDRGIVLFGAGQFRSGINEDILKAAAVHFSMQTPDYELNDRIYSTLSPEFKARLSQLKQGETLVQYPALRSAVFARFPRPFLMTGAKWRESLPPSAARPFADCVAERLGRVDPQQSPDAVEVRQLLKTIDSDQKRKDVVSILRDVEMAFQAEHKPQRSPWEEFAVAVRKKYAPSSEAEPLVTPAAFMDDDIGDDNE